MTDKNDGKKLVISDVQVDAMYPFSIDLKGTTERPSESDRKWAKNFVNTDIVTLFADDKEDKFLRAISIGSTWRVAFALYVDEKPDNNEQFITSDLGREALIKAIDERKISIVKCLLENDFLNIYGLEGDTYNKIIKNLSKSDNREILKTFVEGGHLNINAVEQEILFKAAISEDTGLCLFILKLGSDYNHALKRIKKRKYSGEIFALNSAIEIFTKEAGVNVSGLALTAPEGNWEVMSDDKIVQHDHIPSTEIKLDTIFNFKARNVTIICSSEKTASPTIHVQNFKDIEDDSILFEAWEKLKDAGKKPPEFKGNDNFTVHKPKPDPKLKIQGK